MTDYTKIECPVCDKDFTEERPVICPDCGAPYHRECWVRSGQCEFEDLHKHGFVWVAAEAAAEPEPIKDGFVDEVPGTFFERENLFAENLFAKSSSPEERYIYDVTEKEISYFLGEPDPFRFIKYRKIASGKIISLNIFAALFSPFYFFYSRMRLWGVAVAILSFMLRLPGNYRFFYEIVGAAPPIDPATLTSASNLLNYILIGLQVALALYYDYFYLNWMSFKIKSIRSLYMPPDGELTELGEDYYLALRSAGQPSLLYMALDSIAVTSLLSLMLFTVLFTMI